jgi:hypothetical protein
MHGTAHTTQQHSGQKKRQNSLFVVITERLYRTAAY